jgi:hypothetical protein
VKQTRKIIISDRVITSKDLTRFAKVLDEQPRPAKGDHVSTEYAVRFDDHTLLESDTPDVFQEEWLTSHGRPVSARMSYRNYSLGRNISVSIQHGEFGDGDATVTGDDLAWVNANFQSLQDALGRVRPQSVWIRRHKGVMVNLIALGIGCLGFLILDLFDWFLTKMGWSDVIFRAPPSWGQKLVPLIPLFTVIGWFARWLFGFLWGAFAVQGWLLEMWPSIEFDFGLPHLQIEKIRRERLISVIVLIVLPIGTTFLYDLIKRGFP